MPLSSTTIPASAGCACVETLDRKARLSLIETLFATRSGLPKPDPEADRSYSNSIASILSDILVNWDINRSLGQPKDLGVEIGRGEIEREVTKAFVLCHKKRRLRDPFVRQRETLSSIFGLCPEEIELLCLIYSVHTFGALKDLLSPQIDDCTLSEFYINISLILGTTVPEIKRMLNLKGQLISMSGLML